MAIVTNTFTTFDAKGIREDLSNIITNIAPEDVPYQSNIGRESISNSLFTITNTKNSNICQSSCISKPFSNSKRTKLLAVSFSKL